MNLDPGRWYNFEIRPANRKSDLICVVARPVATFTVGGVAFVRLRFPYKGPGKSKPVTREVTYNVLSIQSFEEAKKPPDGVATTYARGKLAEAPPLRQRSMNAEVAIDPKSEFCWVCGDVTPDKGHWRCPRHRPDFTDFGSSYSDGMRARTAWAHLVDLRRGGHWHEYTPLQLFKSTQQHIVSLHKTPLPDFLLRALVQAFRADKVVDSQKITAAYKNFTRTNKSA